MISPPSAYPDPGIVTVLNKCGSRLQKGVISLLHTPELGMVIESEGGSNDLPGVTCAEMLSAPEFNQNWSPASVVLLTMQHFSFRNSCSVQRSMDVCTFISHIIHAEFQHSTC